MQLSLQGVPVKHLHEPRAGKCRIQNRAIAQATGEILVFLDDDLIVAPGYLEAVERFFDTHREFAAMKGRILPAEDPEKKVGPMAVYLDLPIADDGEEVIEVRGVLGANMAFRASALRQVGSFDERLGPGAGGHEEETEMSDRIRRAGFRIGYAPKALVYHEVDAARASRAMPAPVSSAIRSRVSAIAFFAITSSVECFSCSIRHRPRSRAILMNRSRFARAASTS